MAIFLPQFFTPVNVNNGSIANAVTKNAMDGVFTNLTSSISSGATSLTVDDPQYFPNTNDFQVVIGSEILSVTGGAGTSTWTVTRAQRDTTASAHLAGAQVTALVFTITAGAKDYSLWAAQTLTISRMTNGGDMDATWTADIKGEPTLPDLGDAVVISDWHGPFWIGIIDEINPKYRSGGCLLSITARGYSALCGDVPYTTTQKWPAFTLVTNIFRESRNALVSSISVNNSRVGAHRVIPVETGDYWGKTAIQIWNEYAAQGEPDGSAMIWHVDGNDTSTPSLEVRTKPNLTRYQVALANVKESVQFSWKRSGIYSGVIIKWANGIFQKTSASALAAIGTKYLVIDATNQIDNIILAQSVANQILSVRGRVQNIIGPITIQYPNPVVETFTGQNVPLWRVMSGWPIEITDVETNNVNVPVAAASVKQVTFNFSTRELTIQTEELLTMSDYLAQAIKQEAQKLDSTAHTADPGTAVIKPDNVPTTVSTGTASFNSDNRIGYTKMPDGADIYTITFNFSGALIENEYDVAHIHVNSKLLASWILTGNSQDETAETGATVSVGWRTYEGTMANFTEMYELGTGANEKNLAEFAPTFPHEIEAGQILVCKLLSFVEETDQVAVSVKLQKIAGQSTDKPDTVSPVFTSATITPLANGWSRVTLVTGTIAKAQIEYGPDTNYGAWSFKSDNLQNTHTFNIPSSLSGMHYRVRLWNRDDVETVTGDATF